MHHGWLMLVEDTTSSSSRDSSAVACGDVCGRERAGVMTGKKK